jgi:hypothetical protein
LQATSHERAVPIAEPRRVDVRQYPPKDNLEVGRVSWHFAAPDFFKRRRELEAQLFAKK